MIEADQFARNPADSQNFEHEGRSEKQSSAALQKIRNPTHGSGWSGSRPFYGHLLKAKRHAHCFKVISSDNAVQHVHVFLAARWDAVGE
jgi:hypothetical protein